MFLETRWATSNNELTSNGTKKLKTDLTLLVSSTYFWKANVMNHKTKSGVVLSPFSFSSELTIKRYFVHFVDPASSLPIIMASI